MRIRFAMVAVIFVTMALTMHGQNATPPIATDKASYFAGPDIQNIWKDLEKKQVINQRIVEGGAYSVNIRIVKQDDLPLVHGQSLDVWIVNQGSATAITGGQLVDAKRRGQTDDYAGTSITNGIEKPLKTGDIIFVPESFF